ncbi:MAG: IS110 family transposase, partial [Acidimicrobiales bacterium]
MTIRRIVGIDLGVTTSHTVVVIDETTEVLARRRCRPTRESLGTIEQAALAGAPASTTLEVIMEPTGAAWLPVAVFFARRGHVVHRVSSAKASAMRRFLSQHTKANSIDAEALARLAIVDPGGLQPLRLVEGPAATLDRRVRAADRLTDAANSRKVRLRELARQAMPMIDLAVTGELGVADIAVLERYGDPRQLLRAGRTRLLSLITKASRGHHGETRADAWRRVAELALELYGADPAVPFEDLAAEMATEARLIRALVAERDAHARQRELAYRVVDPDGLARTLPGVAEIGGPVIVSTMGEPSRFGGTASFKRFTGLTPRASETGNSDRKGGAMSKAGPRRLRDQLVQSANTARRLDPQLAAIYFTQMERGAHHQKALCVVAARLAERAWIVMSSGKPYQLRDVDGTPVTAAEARDIIRQRYTVSEEVRRRRRSRKTAGKAPQQVLEAHGLGHARHRADSRGDLPRVITQLDAVPPIKPFSATR